MKSSTENSLDEETMVPVDGRIIVVIFGVCIIFDIALIMGIVSCIHHIAKWFAPH